MDDHDKEVLTMLIDMYDNLTSQTRPQTGTNKALRDLKDNGHLFEGEFGRVMKLYQTHGYKEAILFIESL